MPNQTPEGDLWPSGKLQRDQLIRKLGSSFRVLVHTEQFQKKNLRAGKAVNLGSCQKGKCRWEERAMSSELSQHGVRKESEHD